MKGTKLVRLKDGSKKMQVRNLYQSVIETYALFLKKFGNIIGKSIFAELRRKNFFLNLQTPENICLCKYYENYISALNIISKNCHNIPTYNENFLTCLIICENSTNNCWRGKCSTVKTNCKGRYKMPCRCRMRKK